MIEKRPEVLLYINIMAKNSLLGNNIACGTAFYEQILLRGFLLILELYS